FKTFSQFSRKCFKFLFVHNLPVSVVGVKISKTGNYTILFTVSRKAMVRNIAPFVGRSIPLLGLIIIAADVSAITYRTIRDYNMIARGGDKLW
ncbi:hypothetical protein B7R75_15145, partial [Yersinia pseudotuberculosis]